MKYIVILFSAFVFNIHIAFGVGVKDSIPEKVNIVDRAFNLADNILGKLNGEKWSFIPVVTYSPETSLGFGGRAIRIFKDPNSNPAEARPSTLPITFLYTLHHQTLFTMEYDNWRRDNNHHLYSRLELIDYPFKFFGVGNNVGQDMEEYYSSKFLNYTFAYEWRIGKAIYIGPQYHFRLEDVYQVEDERLLFNKTYQGSTGQRLSGLGFLMDYDTRDNIFQPSRGIWLDLSLMAYNKIIGSEYSFFSYKLDLRKYQNVYKKHVLAAQAVFNFTEGETTFQNLSYLGGSEMMRGIFEGRYRDKHAMAFQLEYRLPIYRKLGVVLYGSSGQVAKHINEFSFNDFHHSGGMGFRYTFGDSGLNIRLDLAYGDRRAMYFGLNEAF